MENKEFYGKEIKIKKTIVNDAIKPIQNMNQTE